MTGCLDQNVSASRKILIISYLFPPAGGIGVQRALSMAKYLPRCGFEVSVLKASDAGGPVRDADLLRQVPPHVKVYDAFTPEIPFTLRQKLWSRFLGSGKAGNAPAGPPPAWKRLLNSAVTRVLCPEPEILWTPFARRKARQIIRQEGIEFVLVTVPPFSALVVGNALKREFPHLKLISDFRDEWLTFYLKDFEFQNNDRTYRRASAIERETVEVSDLVVAVNESSRLEIRRRYPDQPEEKFAVAPNGYDPEVFRGFSPRRNLSPRMLVTHVGTVYKTATPRFYLEALDGLPEEVRANIETRFIGRISHTERALFDNRRSTVTALGFMPQSEALKYMEDTDYLLLNMTNDISVPGKFFEYLATGKPILAITAPGGEADQILRETGSGVSAPPDDIGRIREMLLRAYAAWRDGTEVVRRDPARAQRYQRPCLVEEYGRLIGGLGNAASCARTGRRINLIEGFGPIQPAGTQNSR